MIEVVNTPVTIEATNQENQVNEATNTFTLNPPEWTQVLSQFDSLFSAVLKYAEPHIERMVEKKVAEALAKHVEALRDIATEIAEDVVQTAMSDHTNEYDHDDYDRTVGNMGDIINDAIYDYDFDDKVADAMRSYDIEDKINDAINNCDMEDKIKDTVRDMTFNIRVE